MNPSSHIHHTGLKRVKRWSLEKHVRVMEILSVHHLITDLSDVIKINECVLSFYCNVANCVTADDQKYKNMYFHNEC